jgi:hypothetical protein
MIKQTGAHWMEFLCAPVLLSAVPCPDEPVSLNGSQGNFLLEGFSVV